MLCISTEVRVDGSYSVRAPEGVLAWRRTVAGKGFRIVKGGGFVNCEGICKKKHLSFAKEYVKKNI